MPITRTQAKEICTKPEYELVEASFRPAVTGLSAARLRSKLERARRLQEKYRDLARQQHRTSKERTPARPRGASNLRTERKARLFAETRERFEKRLAQLEAKGDAAGERSRKRARAAAGRAERRQTKRQLTKEARR